MLGTLKKLWAKRSSDTWLDYLRTQGMRIGEGTTLFSKPFSITFDITRPWLIEIGKNVQITKGVTILSHGYDGSALKAKYGDLVGSAGKVTIGDNCFIGMNSTILKGTTIGDNVIVGAGSVLTGKNYPSNSVVAGNPAKVICSTEEYLKKRLNAQAEEAKELVVEYFQVYKEVPPKHVLSDFFWLFEDRKNEITEYWFINKMKNMNNFDKSLEKYLSTQPKFNGYNDFIDYCLKDIKG